MPALKAASGEGDRLPGAGLVAVTREQDRARRPEAGERVAQFARIGQFARIDQLARGHHDWEVVTAAAVLADSVLVDSPVPDSEALDSVALDASPAPEPAVSEEVLEVVVLVVDALDEPLAALATRELCAVLVFFAFAVSAGSLPDASWT
jgi:hypothetical protein